VAVYAIDVSGRLKIVRWSRGIHSESRCFVIKGGGGIFFGRFFLVFSIVFANQGAFFLLCASASFGPNLGGDLVDIGSDGRRGRGRCSYWAPVGSSKCSSMRIGPHRGLDRTPGCGRRRPRRNDIHRQNNRQRVVHEEQFGGNRPVLTKRWVCLEGRRTEIAGPGGEIRSPFGGIRAPRRPG